MGVSCKGAKTPVQTAEEYMPFAQRKGWHPVGVLPILERTDTLRSVSVWEAAFSGTGQGPVRGTGWQFSLSCH